MSFDWTQYLNLARELTSQPTSASTLEAKRRDAISRAYYAAFISARNHLRDREGLALPATAAAHQVVYQQFSLSSDPTRQTIATALRKLRLYRNQADYIDRFPGLTGATSIAIQLAEETLQHLSTL